MDGGRCVTDAVTEAFHIANVGRALAGLAPEQPKAGARFHFEMPAACKVSAPQPVMYRLPTSLATATPVSAAWPSGCGVPWKQPG